MCLVEFIMKYVLNIDFVTYSNCVQTIKKYIKGPDVDVQNNNSSNMRKSLTIIRKVQKGTRSYYVILVENKSKPKCCIKWNSTLTTVYLFF